MQILRQSRISGLQDGWTRTDNALPDTWMLWCWWQWSLCIFLLNSVTVSVAASTLPRVLKVLGASNIRIALKSVIGIDNIVVDVHRGFHRLDRFDLDFFVLSWINLICVMSSKISLRILVIGCWDEQSSCAYGLSNHQLCFFFKSACNLTISVTTSESGSSCFDGLLRCSFMNSFSSIPFCLHCFS